MKKYKYLVLVYLPNSFDVGRIKLNFKEAVKMFSWFKRKNLEAYLFYENSEKYILLASTIKGGIHATVFKSNFTKVC